MGRDLTSLSMDCACTAWSVRIVPAACETWRIERDFLYDPHYHGLNLAQAEEKTHEFLQKHCLAHKIPLCGNSIGQDRRFLVKYMPALNDFFHYRNVDVSSIKELVNRWYPRTGSCLRS